MQDLPSTMPSSSTDLHDVSSAAYKKARRQHLKSTRNRDNHIEADWTPFRLAEKKYKAKFPPPDLSGVLDLALLDPSRSEECRLGNWTGSLDAIDFHPLCIDSDTPPRKAYISTKIPGLVLLPSFVSPEEQRDLIRVSLRDHAQHPNETNLDTHYILPDRGLWNAFLESRQRRTDEDSIQPRSFLPVDLSSHIHAEPGPRQLISNEAASKENFAKLSASSMLPYAPTPNARISSPAALVPKLRWANIGWYYHWGTKQYDFSRGRIPVHPAYREVCTRAVRAVPWAEVFASDQATTDEWGDEPDWRTWHNSYEPDAGIVNFYHVKDTLMAHVDRSEVCATSPLVSISLGCAAVFLIGGNTRDTEPVPLLLRSGDVVIMSGPRCRRAYHGVPRILEDTLPAHFRSSTNDEGWVPYEEYIRTTRININVRQVFPKGFDPGV